LPSHIVMSQPHCIAHGDLAANWHGIKVSCLKRKPREQVIVTNDRIVEVDSNEHDLSQVDFLHGLDVVVARVCHRIGHSPCVEGRNQTVHGVFDRVYRYKA
jgi:hypothetical protein